MSVALLALSLTEPPLLMRQQNQLLYGIDYSVTTSVSCAHIVSVKHTELSYDCGCSAVAVYGHVLLQVTIKQIAHLDEQGRSAGERSEDYTRSFFMRRL